ncbi:hypothetical protein Barb7_02849 [Bacteroidales bacterium Barb7]|nr:hypothetical protein Barb7_02849 [Bacteroidales bacterium Barb7]
MVVEGSCGIETAVFLIYGQKGRRMQRCLKETGGAIAYFYIASVINGNGVACSYLQFICNGMVDIDTQTVAFKVFQFQRGFLKGIVSADIKVRFCIASGHREIVSMLEGGAKHIGYAVVGVLFFGKPDTAVTYRTERSFLPLPVVFVGFVYEFGMFGACRQRPKVVRL